MIIAVFRYIGVDSILGADINICTNNMLHTPVFNSYTGLNFCLGCVEQT